MHNKLSVELANKLERETVDLSLSESLKYLTDQFKDSVSFSTSFSMEDQVITHLIASNDVPIKIFTLDTGRHFEETFKVHNRTIENYKLQIDIYHPDATQVENLVRLKGPLSFYQSFENRKECCGIRKVKPLQRALSDVSIWITGLRNEHSQTREQISAFAFDSSNSVIKYNPLWNWHTEMVIQYIKKHNIPYNTLFDKGFQSIGCAPCTRPVRPGGDIRSGRWWWEQNTSKECGLHETEKK